VQIGFLTSNTVAEGIRAAAEGTHAVAVAVADDDDESLALDNTTSWRIRGRWPSEIRRGFEKGSKRIRKAPVEGSNSLLSALQCL
jgi:hypothetical protein